MQSATLWKNEVKEQNEVKEHIEVLRFPENVRHSPEFLEICRILELDPDLGEYRIKADVEGQLKRPHSNRGGESQGLRD
jgi:hypothetical protein